MPSDLLGDGFDATTLELRPDDEGRVVATVIHKPCAQPSRRAVLYVHGFVDYFFHAELAQRYVDQGFHFYAIDLRKYGRSLLPHQTPNFCRDIAEYFEDLDAAIDYMVQHRALDTVLLNGHSTGGLIAALYAHQTRAHPRIHGLFLNSPFFEFNLSTFEKRVLLPLVAQLGLVFPYHVVPTQLSVLYGLSLHRDYHGEWEYNLAWKPLEGFLVRAGWIRAISRAHRQVHAGLAIPCPVLVMCSATSSYHSQWDDALLRTDRVLDVRDIRRYADALGDHVTRISIPGGMHDLVLSAAPVRERVYAELFRWTKTYL